MGSFVVPTGLCYVVRYRTKGVAVARKPTDTVQLKLRFPERLRRQLEREAAKNERSMNAEIVERLKQSFRRDDWRELAWEVAERSTHRTVVNLVELLLKNAKDAETRALLEGFLDGLQGKDLSGL
jgi:hypothetical protein